MEGRKAGGHLGTDRPLFDVLPEVAESVGIPVIAAGVIIDGEDIVRAVQMGASGVQMGTRFVACHECDAHPAFKQMYVDCNEGDTVLVKTTVGLEGRAIRNPFTDLIYGDKKGKNKKCYNCLKQCSYLFCTLDSLKHSVDGDVDKGLVFAGSRVHEIKEIFSVQTIMDNLNDRI